MQQSVQTVKRQPFLLLAIAALVVAATRSNAMGAIVIALAFALGLVVGGWAPAARRGTVLTVLVVLIALFPITVWVINQSSTQALNAFLAACGAVVGIVVRASFRTSVQASFGARDFFILLGGAGALVGATVAHAYIVPLTFVPLGIAAAISISARHRQ